MLLQCAGKTNSKQNNIKSEKVFGIIIALHTAGRIIK